MSDFTFGFVPFALFGWLVPKVSIVIGKYRNTLLHSEFMDWEGERLKAGFKAVRDSALAAIGFALLMIIVGALFVSLLTTELDERVALIVEGLSLIGSALIITVISLEVPKWTGVYYSYSQYHGGAASVDVGKGSLKELKFRTACSVWYYFGLGYFLLWPFFVGEKGAGLPVSIIVGLFFGFAIDVFVYLSRKRTRDTRNKMTVVLALAIAIASGGVFARGALFIAEVWVHEDYQDYVVYLPSFFIWFVLASLGHWYLYWNTKRLRQSDEAAGYYPPSIAAAPAHRPNTATSMFFMTKSRRNKPPRDEQASQEIVVEGDEEQEEQDKNEDTMVGEKNNTSHGVREEEDEISSNEIEEPTYLSLIREKFRCRCCGCARGENYSMRRKVFAITGWTIWTLLNLAALYFVIVNIGACHQAAIVNEKLPAVYDALYRYIDEGEVCAFDNRGADSNITTFADKDAAHAANFSVLHCGACGHCSDWHNLGKEYTTRNFLAKESARCARKSIFGSYEDLVSCLEKEPIGFQGECARCWATDILCTKGNCTFIFLQSVLIRAVGNFAVTEEMVTAASCEEAHCEVGQFVPCSGATRRRMNVTGSIARPGAQRCSIVDVNWAELFPE